MLLRSELGHDEAPPEPVQSFHSDPLPEPPDPVDDGPETLLQLLGLAEAEQPSLAPLPHCETKRKGLMIPCTTEDTRPASFAYSSSIVLFAWS